jgi:hypothetical protein
LTTLAPGTHEVVATPQYPNGSTGELVATLATSDPSTASEAPVTISVTRAGGAPEPLADWALPDGVVAFRGTTPEGPYAPPTQDNVLLPREVAFEGTTDAVLDGRRPGERYDMNRFDASVSFSGLVVRDAGKVFTFDLLAHRVDRFVIERSEFTDVYAPAHVTEAPPRSSSTSRSRTTESKGPSRASTSR